MMDNTYPANETCLTEDERREVTGAWRNLRSTLQPIDALIEQTDQVDCQELHAAFLRVATAFETFERTIMRAQQIRLLHAAQQR
jgi:hypothetical protein